MASGLLNLMGYEFAAASGQLYDFGLFGLPTLASTLGLGVVLVLVETGIARIPRRSAPARQPPRPVGAMPPCTSPRRVMASPPERL